MAAPTNTAITTATALSPTLPVTVTQQVDDSGTTYTVWYSIVSAGTGILGIWAFGDLSVYMPTLTVWLGPTGSPTQYPTTFGAAINVPVQIPVTSGTTYYLKIQTNSGNPSPANLTLNLQWAPNDAVPVGSLFIPDDTAGYPAACVDATTGDVLQYVNPFPNGESGDVLPTSGISLFEDSPNNQVILYNSQFGQITTIPYTSTAGDPAISSDLVDTFYVGTITSGTTGTVKSVSSVDGSILQTWTLTSCTALRAIAPNVAETILYVTAKAGTLDSTISQWDLVNNVWLSDFASSFGANYAAPHDIVVLGDGTVVVLYQRGTANMSLRSYSAAGAVLQTITFSNFDGIGSRLTHAIDDPNSFWVWIHSTDGGPSPAPHGEFSTFYNIKASDFSTITSVTTPVYEEGVFGDLATATPGRFGTSFSCPFIVLRAGTPSLPPGTALPSNPNQPNGTGSTTTTYPIRRVRQSPHFSTDQLWQFFSNFQLDIEAGVGLTTGQGSDPVAMLSWSDDGGHTWSNERWLHFGKIGEYTKRAMLRGSVGRSRDRIWKVVISDPVPVRILQAMVMAEKGLS